MKNEKKSNKVTISRFLYIFLIIVIIVLVVLIFLFFFRAYRSYSVLRSHERYFRQENQQIESWMNIHIIEKRFNITENTLSEELNTNASKLDIRLTLDSICKKNHLNCSEVVNDLNNLKK